MLYELFHSIFLLFFISIYLFFIISQTYLFVLRMYIILGLGTLLNNNNYLHKDKYKKFHIMNKQKTPHRNENCICGSGKKYKKCCFNKFEDFKYDFKYELDHLTDKYNILWCCIPFFKSYTQKWKFNILHHELHGKRYYTRMELFDEELIKTLSSKYYTKERFILFDNKTKHFGYFFQDKDYPCKSRFSKNSKIALNGLHVCSEKCNLVELQQDDRAIYETVCEHCQDNDCGEFGSLLNGLLYPPAANS